MAKPTTAVSPVQDTEAANKLWEPARYNRISVDGIHVSRLAEVIRAGANLPPVTVDAETLEIVDGVHRWKAYQRVYGIEAPVPVYRRKYVDDQTRFREGLEANAGHGRALSPADMRHCILQAQDIGLDLEVVRDALMITRETFEEYKQQFAVTESGERLPLSRSNLHLAGKVIPDAAVEQIRGGSGSTIRSLARQLSRHLQSGFMDWADEMTMTQLQELSNLLDRTLAGKVA